MWEIEHQHGSSNRGLIGNRKRTAWQQRWRSRPQPVRLRLQFGNRRHEKPRQTLHLSAVEDKLTCRGGIVVPSRSYSAIPSLQTRTGGAWTHRDDIRSHADARFPGKSAVHLLNTTPVERKKNKGQRLLRGGIGPQPTCVRAKTANER